VEFEEFRAALQSCRPTQREALLLIGAPSFSYTADPQGFFSSVPT